MTETKPAGKPRRGTRMWGVVTKRGKVLGVSASRSEVWRQHSYEVGYEGAKVRRVIVAVEG